MERGAVRQEEVDKGISMMILRTYIKYEVVGANLSTARVHVQVAFREKQTNGLGLRRCD